MKLDTNKIELLTEAKMTELLSRALSKLKWRGFKNIKDIQEKAKSNRAPKKYTDNLELDHDILVSNIAVKRFMRNYDPNYFETFSKKEIISEIKYAYDTLDSWLEVILKTNNLPFTKKEALDRFLPFYAVGNGDLVMLDKKTKKVVFFIHDDQRLFLTPVGKKLKVKS